MQIPIINGIYADSAPDLRTKYPRNLVPVPKESGIAAGYLRPAEGLVSQGFGFGTGRGGCIWDGVLYRVMGNTLLSIDAVGAITQYGTTMTGSNDCSMASSFDKLAITSGGNLYLFNGFTVSQVTDTDLGTALDVIWVDGYFMTHDGTNLVVTELTDPTSVDPLKYGSSEADPDPIKRLLKLRSEVYVLNRYTIETFNNIGGTGFPFQRVTGATIPQGCIGTRAAAVFADRIAFVGGARDDSLGVWLGVNGSAEKISTREVDTVISGYTEAQQEAIVLETRSDKAHRELWMRLPDRTLVYDIASSTALGTHIWHERTTSVVGYAQHRARDLVYCYGVWNVADTLTGQFGVLDDTISTHWGANIGWDFNTAIVYAEARGALFHELELVSLTGNVAFGDDPVVWTQYSTDGVTWSTEKPAKVGKTGARDRRIAWFGQGPMQKTRMQRFRGTSDAHISPIRLEARLEPLAH
jgi:hypothetical protein